MQSYFFTDVRGFLMRVNRHVAADASADWGRISISGALVPGWQTDTESDMELVPDPASVTEEPFGSPECRMVIAQPVQPGAPMGSYSKDVRAVAARCESLLADLGVADKVQVGCELEFNLLRGIRFCTTTERNAVELQECDGWNGNSDEFSDGHRIGHRSMHFLAPPADRHEPVRREICAQLAAAGIVTTHDGHEAGPSQQEIALSHTGIVRAADQVQLTKHIVRNVASARDFTATFMPRTLAYAECNGMHVNLSLWRGGRNLFFRQSDAGAELSSVGMQFVAGILTHLQALNAITNPTVNSYKRLNHVYSLMRPAGWGYRNRTVAIRVPHFTSDADCRIEIRFPDPSANPYLAFAALVCAGLDGMKRELHAPPVEQGAPMWYEQPFNAGAMLDAMAPDLRVALAALASDHAFLTAHKVFDESLIQSIVKDGSFFWHWAATTPAPQEYQVFFGH